MRNILSTIISVLVIFMMLCVTPLYYISTVQYARSSSTALSATRNLIDEVIDTRELTDTTLSNYNIEMAAIDNYYSVTILHKVKVVNPDPANPGSTYTSYVAVDDLSTYQQGDKIYVTVKPVGKNLFQTISYNLMGLTIPNEGFTLVGRIR